MSNFNTGAYEFIPGQGYRGANRNPPNNTGNNPQGGPPQGGPPFNPYAQNPYQTGPGQPYGGGYGQYYPPGQGYPQGYGQNPYGNYPYQPQPHHASHFAPPPQSHEVPRATPPPAADRPLADPPKSVSISLNIGGSTPAPAPKAAEASKTETPTTSTAKPATKPPAAVKAETKVETKTSKAEKTDTGASTPKSGAPKVKDVFSLERAKNDAEAIAKEQAALVDDETLKAVFGDKEEEIIDPNVKTHMNVVFTGHVDAGKSTLGGQILVLCGMVDKRTLEKWEKESKEAGRETWYLSWALDSTQQERDKGKTVEVGRAYFETDKKRYTILDAPGHNTFVPSMITGAAQADVSVLVISARKGEFETGFEKGGQTREHITLVRTAGVNRIIIVINKMDDPTVQWSKERYDEIVGKLTPFAKASGYNPKTDLTYIPVSAYTGVNVKERLDSSVCPWYSGPALLEYLDAMTPPDRKLNGPVMIPIAEKYKDMGTVIVGKIESGRVRKGDHLLMMPNGAQVEVSAIFNEMEDEITSAFSGDNIRVRLKGVEDEDISPGYVLTSVKNPVHAVKSFTAQLAILESRNIISAGYGAVLHVHTLSEEVVLTDLLHYLDKKTGRKSTKPPQYAKKGMRIIAKIETQEVICIEPFSKYPQLGRFTLRDEGKTVAIGKVLKLFDENGDQIDKVIKATAGLKI